MQAQVSDFTKGQRIEWTTGVTRMGPNGFERYNERVVQGVVVGFFKSKRYIRVRMDGAAKDDTSLLTPRDIDRVL
jgi:hypothetical protein